MLNRKQLEASKLLSNVTEIPDPVKAHILYVVNGMVGTSNLRLEDMKDIVMVMAERIIMAKAKVEEAGGTVTNAYLNRVTDNTRNQIYRNRGRGKRGLDIPTISLDVPVGEDDPDNATSARLEFETATQPDHSALEHEDVRAVVDGLPHPLKKICQLFMAGLNFEQIAAELHITPWALRTHYWPRLKPYFIAAGFGR
jgi:DNA-directed RNA polymerase specialized sigma24 family protein